MEEDDKKKKRKQQLVQLTLLEVIQGSEERDPITTYKTDFFEIKTTDKAVNSVMDKINKQKKVKVRNQFGDIETQLVDVYSENDKRIVLMEWIQKKMRPTEPDIIGDEWDTSRLSLFKKIFDKNYFAEE